MTSNKGYRWHSCSKEDFPFKRHKVPKACQLCRQKKMRCDGLIPCARCTQNNLECSYEDDGNRRQRTEHIKVKDDVLNSDDISNSSHTNNASSFDDNTMDNSTSPVTATPTTEITTKKVEQNPLTRGKHPATLLPPVPQQQQEHEYQRLSLKRISFSNDLYETMRQNDTSVITKSYLLGTKLPPLLFDFFNLTSQPYKIWLHFITQFRQFLKLNNNSRSSSNNNNAIPDNLSKEIINLFSKFNWLYSTMFNFTLLHSAAAPALAQLFSTTLSSSSSSSNNASTSNNNVTSAISGLQTPTSSSSPNNNTIDSHSNHIDNKNSMEQLIVYAIHALVFHAAFQSLATSCQSIASNLEYYADLFYREALRRFWDAALLVDKNRSLDNNALLQLTRVSVLLAHYQCSAICEEQAYITLRVGIGYALRCGLADIIRTNSTNDHVIQTNEKKRLKALYHILNAWKTWFSFYLHRNEWYDDDNQLQTPLSPNNPNSNNNNSISTTTVPKMNDLTAVDSKILKQRWALQVVDTYTEFLKRLSKNNMKYSEIKEQLSVLQSWSTNHGQVDRKNSAQEQQDYSRASSTSLPACILSIYHHTLTIQVFFCQLPESLNLFRRNSGSLSLAKDNAGNDKASSRNVILDICDQAAADIVHIIDDLTMDYHSLPSGATDQTRQRDPIVHTVLYPLCLAASVSVSCLRQRKSPSNGLNYSDNKYNGDEQENHDNQNRNQPQKQQQHQYTGNKRKKKRHNARHATEAVAVVAATAAAEVRASTEPKAATLMPIYKLQRLLNPIRSQIEAADVFTESLDEIQATAAASKPAHQQMLSEDPDNHRFMPIPSTTMASIVANAATSNNGGHSMVASATGATVFLNPQLQRPPAHTTTATTKPPTRFVDHQWPESLGQAFSDESFLNDTLPLQGGAASGRGPGFPLDRNDIDREQLEKLSRKKDLRSNSSTNSGGSNGVNSMQITTMPGNTTVDIFKTNTAFSEAAAAAAAAVAGGNAPTGVSLRHPANQGSSDAYAIHTSNTMRRRRNTVAFQQHQQQTLLAHGQKRQYAQTATSYPNLDMDYQQQVITPKRMRTDSVYSDQMDMLRTDRYQHQQQHPRLSAAAVATNTSGNFSRTQQPVSNNLSMQEIHDQSGMNVYTTTDLLLMDLTGPVATGTAAATTNTSSDPNVYQQQQPSRVPTIDRSNNSSTMRNEPPATPGPFTSNVPGTSAQAQTVATVTPTTGSMVSNITSNAPKVPLLPAPQPNLSSNKGWTARPKDWKKDWNNDFQQSILETLHNTAPMHVEQASFGPGIVDPSSMSLNIDPMTSHTSQQPALSDSNGMYFFFSMENQQQQQHRLTHTSHHHQQQGEWVGPQQPQQQQQALSARLHHSMHKSGHSMDGRRGEQQHYQQQQRQLQRRMKSPRVSSSLNQQHQAPSLSEPTNSSVSDGRSTSASPAMFGQETWISQVPNQNKMTADVMAADWN